MSTKGTDNEVQLGSLKNEAARQRWELFHRAIAHAKQSNNNELQETDSPAADSKPTAPVLSIAR
jgi:hypothetical protein